MIMYCWLNGLVLSGNPVQYPSPSVQWQSSLGCEGLGAIDGILGHVPPHTGSN